MTKEFKFSPPQKPKHLEDKSDNFDLIRISIASPEQIRSWSYGEVKKSDTINYRTFKPERDGLFCARIFGPIKDYECGCGKYKRIKFKGLTCEKCNVEVTLSKVRRERMGHIELASPVAHIWFFKSLPSRIGLLLDLNLKEIEKILYFENYVVIDPGLTPYREHQLLTEEEYTKAKEEYGEEMHGFKVMIGAAALRSMLKELDLVKEHHACSEELQNTASELKRKKITRRLKLLKGLHDSKIHPEWMVLDVIPVLPPDLRPLVPLDGGRFASSDLNDLYRRVINRNNRLKRLIELRAPDIILRNEKRMLQEAVDTLFDNGRRGRLVTGTNKRPLKSLADMLKGKQGRFRQNLLGKRVDFSGRSVIVVGPELKLHQCGLPKQMALELFKPMIYASLMAQGIAPTIKTAKRMVERERSEVWDILEEVIREYPVFLNRAPTLHRLGIQAFEPILVEGKAIQLHPLVCTAFNADFDGDQMAVHIPLSIEAQLEARVLMMSTNNILSPANGKPIIVPSQDIILGLYYLSLERPGAKGQGMIFSSVGEIEHALEAKVLDLHAPITTRLESFDRECPLTQRVQTTPGRILLSTILPTHPNISFDLINKPLTKKEVTQLLDLVYRNCGQKNTVIFSDRLMQLGFIYASRSGISIGQDDFMVPKEKQTLVHNANEKIKDFEQQYLDGLVLQGEKYNHLVDVWTECTDKVSSAVMKELEEPDKQTGQHNSVHLMVHSGARGSKDQVKQLAGMRGLIAKPSGAIIETPIISSFKEGLTILEYFNSSHGARKGLADTALKTSNAGYLTRRLVDVAQDCVILEHDCRTTQGYVIKDTSEKRSAEDTSLERPFSERIFGRVLAKDVRTSDQHILIPAGTMLGENEIEKLSYHEIRSVVVRSVLTCQTTTGLCSMCYGQDLARGQLVNIGEAVGVIAAQSIGEPGTQLTMRTFHTGGAAQRGVKQNHIEADVEGTVEIFNKNMIINHEGVSIVIGHNCQILLFDKAGVERARHDLPYGSRLFIEQGDAVEYEQKLAEWDPNTVPIICEHNGFIKYKHLSKDITLRKVVDEVTGIAARTVLDWRQHARGNVLQPQLQIFEDTTSETLASTHGVIELYNLKTITNRAHQTFIDGHDCVLMLIGKKDKRIRHSLPYGAKLLVKDGERVRQGQKLVEWDPYTIPIFAKAHGVVTYEDLVEDVSMLNIIDVNSSLTTASTVINWQHSLRGGQPRLMITDPTKQITEKYPLAVDDIILVDHGASVKVGDILACTPCKPNAVYDLSAGSTLSVEENTLVQPGDILARTSRETSKTVDITHSSAGLPRVVELFEARKPKDVTFLADRDGRLEFGAHKSKRRLLLKSEDGETTEYLIPKDKTLFYHEGDYVKKGDYLTSGQPALQDILDILGIERFANHLVEQVQRVYHLQGVNINDKHIEVIARQMLQKVEITDQADTGYLVGEHILKTELHQTNTNIIRKRLIPAQAKPILQGITKASLETRSFISAAAFQETTKILTEAATCGKTDDLLGLKENIIVGRLIPAGTGKVLNNIKDEAMGLDQEYLDKTKGNVA